MWGMRQALTVLPAAQRAAPRERWIHLEDKPHTVLRAQTVYGASFMPQGSRPGMPAQQGCGDSATLPATLDAGGHRACSTQPSI